MKNLIATLALTLLCSPALAQRSDTTFQNLKLNEPIAAQLPLCEEDFSVSKYEHARCWHPAYSGTAFPGSYEVAIVEKGVDLRASDLLFVTVVGKDMPKEDYTRTVEQVETIGRGKVVSIAAYYDLSVTEEMMNGMVSKRGKPTTITAKKGQTGIGLPITQRTAKWATTWGELGLKAPASNTDEMEMYAYTSEYAKMKLAATQQDKVAKKSEF